MKVTPDDASVEISYTSFDGGGSTLLIGDTIASGATIIAALENYARYRTLRQVFIFSYAGSRRGAERISQHCSKIGIDATILLGLAAFGLGNNGFDLSFLHPDTDCIPEYKERAAKQFAGRAVSAVGWDFGSQATAPDKYRALCWIEAERWGLHGHDSLALACRPTNSVLVQRERDAYADIADRLGI